MQYRILSGGWQSSDLREELNDRTLLCYSALPIAKEAHYPRSHLFNFPSISRKFSISVKGLGHQTLPSRSHSTVGKHKVYSDQVTQFEPAYPVNGCMAFFLLGLPTILNHLGNRLIAPNDKDLSVAYRTCNDYAFFSR